MAKKERFGKFVLLAELDSGGIGTEYRAAKLGPAGLEKLVSVVRLAPGVSANAEVAKSLMDQAKLAAQLQNPNIVKIFGIGKVDAAYYISYEFVEGKSLKAILARCLAEGFPFSVDHTLLIASKVCSALEYAHGRKTETGARYFHGLLTPASVLVSYEGEVRIRGFGYWPGRIREAGLSAEDSLHLSPEQAAGGTGDTRSDIFAVGAILFETLTGHPLFEGGRTQDIAGRLGGAKLQSPSGEDDALPTPIAEILQRALAVDPAARYAEVQEMRKAIDTLLFSGDFTPTTFNLAFFMHSLFREDIDRESKALKEEKEASYLDFVSEEPTRAMPVPRPPGPAAPPTPLAAAAPSRVEHVEARPPSAHREEPSPLPAAAPPPEPVHAPSASAKEAAAGFTFHKEEPKSRAPLLAGVAAVMAVAAAGGYFAFLRGAAPKPPPPEAVAPSTLSPEVLAAQQRVKELEEKLRQIEEEKAAAEQKAREDAAARLKKEAQAKGQAVDPAALEKAQKEAAEKARIEQEKKAQEERRRLEEEKKAAEARAAEEARLAEEQRKAAEAAAAAAAAAPPTTAAPVMTQPAVRPGMLVNVSDPGVIAPLVERKPTLTYPPIALRQRVEGTVEVNALVDEKGNVTDAQVTAPAGGKVGLNEAAVEAVKRYRFRPATKDGVPVKVWYSLKVKFELPK